MWGTPSDWYHKSNWEHVLDVIFFPPDSSYCGWRHSMCIPWPERNTASSVSHWSESVPPTKLPSWEWQVLIACLCTSKPYLPQSMRLKARGQELGFDVVCTPQCCHAPSPRTALLPEEKGETNLGLDYLLFSDLASVLVKTFGWI